MMNPKERLIVYGLLAAVSAVTLLPLIGRADRQALAQASPGGNDSAATAPEPDPPTIAFVHIAELLERVMATETYVREQEELLSEIEARDAELDAALQAFEQQYGDVGPDDPRLPQAQAAFEELQTQMEAWRVERAERLGALGSAQLERAYRDVEAAVDMVADRSGYDIVLQYIPSAEPFEAETTEQAMMNIRLRTAVHAPHALDLTAEVLEELAL